MSNHNYQNLFSNYSDSSSNNETAIQNLEYRLNKLEMVSEALWRFIKQNTDLTDEELLKEVCRIDLENGQFDGKKKTASYIECKKCGKNNSKKHTQCLYCGELLLTNPFG